METYDIQINLSLKSKKEIDVIKNAIIRSIYKGLDTAPDYVTTPKDIDFKDITINDITPEEEKTIPITYGLIKATCGWSKWCDVTNGNHYAINEFGDYEDREVFYITETQAKQLKFI